MGVTLGVDKEFRPWANNSCLCLVFVKGRVREMERDEVSCMGLFTLCTLPNQRNPRV